MSSFYCGAYVPKTNWYDKWYRPYGEIIDTNRTVIDNLKRKVREQSPLKAQKLLEDKMYEATNTTQSNVAKTFKFSRVWLVTDSDWVNSLSYDFTNHALQMKTRRGNTYVFDEVDTSTFAFIMTAESIGAAVNATLRNKFEKVM